MKKTTAILIALLMGPSLSVFSQGNSPNNPDDQIARTTKLAQTISELKARINSNDAAMRAAAIEIALSNESPTVRGMALVAALSRFNAITPEIIIEKENPIAPGDLPNIAIQSIIWSKDNDMHSFEGTINLPPHGNVVRGKITDSLLEISFGKVKLEPTLFQRTNQRETAGSSNINSAVIIKPCVAHLRLNTSRNALEGDMTCESLPVKFRLRLGFLG